jgi:hypothetical protein
MGNGKLNIIQTALFTKPSPRQLGAVIHGHQLPWVRFSDNKAV